MSEWFKELVLKTSDSQEPWVRIPLSPPRRSKLHIPRFRLTAKARSFRCFSFPNRNRLRWVAIWGPPAAAFERSPKLHISSFHLQPCRSTQVAIRGSPAKGVDGLNPCEGSNPSFCATSEQAPYRLLRLFSKVRARSFRCSSFPNRTRFAGLRFGPPSAVFWSKLHIACSDFFQM